jgi:hypothetical protein
MTTLPTRHHRDQDEHKGAIEGERSTDEQTGNPNASALDENGLPADEQAIAEDVLGANEDDTQG